MSTPIILRHIHELGGLGEDELREAYERELQRLRPKRAAAIFIARKVRALAGGLPTHS